MLKWLFKNKIKKILTLDQIKTLKIGDLIQIKLKTNFCDHAKKQPLIRFTEKELNTHIIKGIVSMCDYKKEFSCWMLGVITISEDSNNKKITKYTPIFLDEIDEITIF
jgi:hypothetical protein